MITSIEINSFKRFTEYSLPCSDLTVLTGLNGSGKSTVAQALNLMHRSSLSLQSFVGLSSEESEDLGEAADVLNVDSADGHIELGLNSDPKLLWKFDVSQTEEYSPYLRLTDKPKLVPFPFETVDGSYTYLAAERIGPRTSHPSSPALPDQAIVGSDGRFVAHALAIGQRREVAEERRHPSAGSITTLGAQTEAWLSSLIGDTQLDAALVPRTALATLRIREVGGGSGEWMLPTNTGFGVSYCLPIIVAGLTIPTNGLLIVDGPEAHLHPAAQSAIGHFLAVVAGAGVQVIVETHSDHVLNGIRKAVAATRSLDHQRVTISFFSRSVDPQVMKLDQLGRIDRWPKGFFDQFESDLGVLSGLRKSRN